MPDFDMPPAPASFEARGGWLVNRLAAEFGLTLAQAAGIVGNLGYESAGFKALQEMKPAVEGSRGGYGWAQWTGPRRRAFEKWSAENNLKPAADEANYGFLLAELRGSHRATIRDVKKTETLSGAVFSVGQTYERPGGTTATHLPGFDGRLRYAERALAGAGPAAGQAVAEPRNPVELQKDVQRLLAASGDYRGAIDGDPGERTRQALQDYRTRLGV
jgi:hypothetical protein